MLYTSYYNNLHNIPLNIIPVAISGRVPDIYTGIRFKDLAPKYWWWYKWENKLYITKEELIEHGISLEKYSYLINKILNNDDYEVLYRITVLDKLKPQEIINKCLEISNEADFVFICYEEPEKFCHRHILAKWLTEFGFKVEEFSNKFIKKDK